MFDDDRKYPETKTVPSVAKNSAMFIMFRLGFMDGFAKTLRTTFSSVDPVGLPPFEEVQGMVESEFDVEEGFVDHNVPTFYVRYREDSKEAFLRLMKRLDALELLPLLRPKEEKFVQLTVRTERERSGDRKEVGRYAFV